MRPCRGLGSDLAPPPRGVTSPIQFISTNTYKHFPTNTYTILAQNHRNCTVWLCGYTGICKWPLKQWQNTKHSKCCYLKKTLAPNKQIQFVCHQRPDQGAEIWSRCPHPFTLVQGMTGKYNTICQLGHKVMTGNPCSWNHVVLLLLLCLKANTINATSGHENLQLLLNLNPCFALLLMFSSFNQMWWCSVGVGVGGEKGALPEVKQDKN